MTTPVPAPLWHFPAAVVLDILLEGETSWSFLSELKSEVAITRIRDALHKTGLGTDKAEGRRG